MIENRPFMGISPHIDLEGRGIRKEALPTDSVFASSEGKIGAMHPIEMFVTYAEQVKKNPLNPQHPLLHDLAKKLVSSDPSHISFFYDQLVANQAFSVMGERLRQDLLPELKKAACEVDTFSLSENELVAIFTKMHSKPFAALFSGLVQGTIHKAMQDLEPNEIRTGLESGTIKFDDLQYTQDHIVHLMYTLTCGVLKTHDENIIKNLHNLLALKTRLFAPHHSNSGLFAAAGFSLNEDTLSKYILVDFANTLLEKIYSPQSDEVASNLVTALENSATGMHYLNFVKKTQAKRTDEMVAYYEDKSRYGNMSTISGKSGEDPKEYYSHPLSFPENKIFDASKRFLSIPYLEMLSTYLLNQHKLKHPISIIFLPDGSIRYVAPNESDSFEIAQDVMRHISHIPQEVSEPHVVESFLTYLRPRLAEATTSALLANNEQKRDNLIHFPSHGIPAVGLTIAINREGGHAIEAQSISLDQTGSLLDIQIGNTIAHMRLNEQYVLCSLDGTPLSLDQNSRTWWDHVVLPQLHQYICAHPEENEGYMEGVVQMPGESLQEATRRIVTKRIGHLRRLGKTKDGREKKYTKEQRDAVLTHKFLLPHTEILDLNTFNQGKPFGEKVTFVLPIEKELTERPIFHLPHAYEETNNIINGDPLYSPQNDTMER